MHTLETRRYDRKPLQGRTTHAKSSPKIAPVVVNASLRLGWSLAGQPRSFRTFVDHACRYWLEVRTELGISRGEGSAQDIRDLHQFIGAVASAYAGAPLGCADLNGADRDACIAVAGFARLMASEAGVSATLGDLAERDRTLGMKAVAAFQSGYSAARATLD
jgi:hypothetical protein